MNIVDRIQEHLSKLSPLEGDTDTAWFLREAKREIERLEWQAERDRSHTEMVNKCGDAIGGFQNTTNT